MNRNKNDLIAEIKTARDEARTKANAYKNLKVKRYDYWRALAAITAYHKTLAMFEQRTEYHIPGMAAEALAIFERARDNDIPEMNLAVADGRRDALATVADWMNAKESNR